MTELRLSLLTTTLAAAAAAMTVSLWSLQKLIPLNKGCAQLRSAEREVLYVPSGTAIRALSFGFTNAASHLLWFKTIDYFGRHYVSDRNYTWLAHMCSLVSSLSPRSSHVYTFCSTMLAWEAKQPTAALKVLDRAIAALPEDWKLSYLRGMTQLVFFNNSGAARTDFVLAAQNPDAHPVVKRLAAKALADQIDPKTALEFLDDMISQERDPNARKALLDRRLEIVQGRTE